jgi:cystathionine beta-lyase family protein involved in aluminum resistance
LTKTIYDEKCSEKLINIKQIANFIKNIHDYTIINEIEKYKHFMEKDENKLAKFDLLLNIRYKALSHIKDGSNIYRFTTKLYSKKNIYDQLIS